MARDWAGARPSGKMNSPDEREPSGENFWRVLIFAAFALLGLGVLVVGVNQELAAGAAMRPIDSGIAAAAIPVDAALGDKGDRKSVV